MARGGEGRPRDAVPAVGRRLLLRGPLGAGRAPLCPRPRPLPAAFPAQRLLSPAFPLLTGDPRWRRRTGHVRRGRSGDRGPRPRGRGDRQATPTAASRGRAERARGGGAKRRPRPQEGGAGVGRGLPRPRSCSRGRGGGVRARPHVAAAVRRGLAAAGESRAAVGWAAPGVVDRAQRGPAGCRAPRPGCGEMGTSAEGPRVSRGGAGPRGCGPDPAASPGTAVSVRGGPGPWGSGS